MSAREFSSSTARLNPDFVKHVFDLISDGFDKTRDSRHARPPPMRVLCAQGHRVVVFGCVSWYGRSDLWFTKVEKTYNLSDILKVEEGVD